MPTNVSRWERALRLAVGMLLLSWAFAGGPLWAYAGLYLLVTGAWGFCLFYHLIKQDRT